MNSIAGGSLHKMAAKRKHKEVTLKVKYEVLKELEKGRQNEDVNMAFPVAPFLLGRKTKRRYLMLSKIHRQNANVSKQEHIKR